MRPLAGMTPQERAQCRGMWCEDIHGDLYVYLGTPTGSAAHDEETGAPMGTFIDTQEPDIIDAPFAAFATRPDLSRAWQADGQPPAGEWEEDYTDTYGCTLSTGQSIGMAPHQEIRRWIGCWEKA